MNAPVTAPTDAQLLDFVHDEAEMLDEQRYEAWLELFSADGRYWMPLEPGQTDARLHCSLMYEDLMLLRVRVERLHGQRTFSQQPPSRCHHLLQRPRVVSRDDAGGVYTCRTAFHYVETRGDEQTLYAGWSTHTLVLEGAALRMRLKRVDLVNSDAAFGNIQLFM